MRHAFLGAEAAVSAALLVACGGGGSPSPTPVPTEAASSSSSTSSAGPQSAGGTAKVVIDPTHGKAGSVIHVTGSGYKPGITVTGTLCTVDASGQVGNPLTDCDVVNLKTVTTDSTGGFTTDFTIVRVPTPAKAGYQLGFGVPSDPTDSAGATLTIDP